MSAGSAPARPRHLVPRHPGPAAGKSLLDAEQTFTARIDGRSGAVRAEGHLTVRAADMVCGTVEALRRSGHGDVVVDLREVSAVDAGGLRVLESLERSLRDEGDRLTLLHARRSPGQ